MFNINNNKNFNIKNLLKETLNIFRVYNYELLMLAIVPFIAFSLLYNYIGNGTIEEMLNIQPIVLYLVYLFLGISLTFVFPSIMYIVRDRGSNFEFKKIFKELTPKAINVFAGIMVYITILASVFSFAFLLMGSFLSNPIGVGFFSGLLMAISVKFLIDFLFILHAIVLRNQRPLKSFTYSKGLVKKYWWKVFRYYFTFDIIILFLINALSALAHGLIPFSMAVNFLMAFFQSISLILMQIFVSLMFFHLDSEK